MKRIKELTAQQRQRLLKNAIKELEKNTEVSRIVKEEYNKQLLNIIEEIAREEHRLKKVNYPKVVLQNV